MQNEIKFDLSSVEAIVWDWNGTLLDDVDICVDSINEMLVPRNIPPLNYDSYRRIFGFPVKDYYAEAGFDFNSEPFDVVAIQFIDIYRNHLPSCNLFPDVAGVLDFFTKKKISQYILSAMEQKMLEHSLHEKGIYGYFAFVSGTTDHYANNKLDAANRLQQIISVAPENILMIGDTVHDHEVAGVMNWKNLLIASGHQSLQRLLPTGRMVFDNLASFMKFLNGNT